MRNHKILLLCFSRPTIPLNVKRGKLGASVECLWSREGAQMNWSCIIEKHNPGTALWMTTKIWSFQPHPDSRRHLNLTNTTPLAQEHQHIFKVHCTRYISRLPENRALIPDESNQTFLSKPSSSSRLTSYSRRSGEEVSGNVTRYNVGSVLWGQGNVTRYNVSSVL